jgi:hypothetical protein
MGKHHRSRAPNPGATPAGVLAAAVGLGALAAPGIAAAAPATTPSATSPCAPEFKACLSISKHTAWLTDGHGHTLDGPVAVSTGGRGQETPTGKFTVQRKDQNFRSSEYHGAPMPDSVFFDGQGRAFHEGNLGRTSGGCVHLRHDDAQRFFDDLEPDDRVEIMR